MFVMITINAYGKTIHLLLDEENDSIEHCSENSYVVLLIEQELWLFEKQDNLRAIFIFECQTDLFKHIFSLIR
ncbi:hypothetical protein [Zophobihabitans entericus]|uniref:Uncharacterized protein n=1 Tax=Zophobihabitans entericus TaxID=1635327 RepID=A0A6G9IC91_9GAMM|nr:hypothetical protein [Zophobihabitans entericus]QIQ21457.1 hypothetical protein IPMB12_07035 [Zophobihabitans entericus]